MGKSLASTLPSYEFYGDLCDSCAEKFKKKLQKRKPHANGGQKKKARRRRTVKDALAQSKENSELPETGTGSSI
jgi:hypothetical protein